MSTPKIILIACGVATLFFLGRKSMDWGASEASVEPMEQHAGHDSMAGGMTDSMAPQAETLWTCPMHPQIKLPDPGDCPICGMDLVPMRQSGQDNPRQLVMSPAAKQLAQVAVEVVTRRNVTKPVRLVGKVDYDETSVKTISAWVPGRIDRLFVDYKGVQVHQGDHLVSLYSPDLLTAQEELLAVRERLGTTSAEVSSFLAESNQRAYEAAREKLILWGLTEAQVAEIETRGTAEDHVMLTSPTSGVVIEKSVNEGSYVKTGTEIYRIADLSHVWVLLDAYEKDVAWLRYGQEVAFEIEALPGADFRGVIAYIDPMVNDRTRTTKVRVNVDNAEGRLKPGMFVRAFASARIGAGGVVLDQALAGKWVGPMHPEIIKDGPGQCDICGMDLMRAEDLGLVDRNAATAERPIVVSQSAVLVTGKRAVVYVEVPGAERPTYEGREVVLGPRAGDEYVVLEGLQEGERVVVPGAFRIDSSMQILAKPSMMAMPEEAETFAGPATSMFRDSLRPIYAQYFALQEALAGDDPLAARKALSALASELEAPSAAGLPAPLRTVWSEERGALQGALQSVARDADLKGLRGAFESIARAMGVVAAQFGHPSSEPIREVFCPMAFDSRGATWLQRGEQIANPYFGASMLSCGEMRNVFPGQQATVEPSMEPSMEQAMDDLMDDSMDDSMDDLMEPDMSAPAVVDAGTEPETEPVVVDNSALAKVFEHYLEVQVALAADAPAKARVALSALLPATVSAAEVKTMNPVALAQLLELQATLRGAQAKGASDLDALRELFRELSVRLLAIEQAVGNPMDTMLSVVHCPMAFDGLGADWIQIEDRVSNPYFGSSMLGCGAVQRVLEPR